jgi:hypothetical protein
MHAALKHFWMSGKWPPLRHKPLRNKAVGRKEFRPPEWETFVP